MGGIVRFEDGDWLWSNSMTSFLFDFLEESLPEGSLRSEIHELNENNILMLDLRDAFRDTLVDLIVDDFPSYLERNLEPEQRVAYREGYSELVLLAASQRERNCAAGP